MPRRYWPELDLLRGLAALLMIASHTAARAGRVVEGDLIEVGAFLGSFAPVLFFTLTGLGHGIQAVGRSTPGRLGPVAEKVLVLLAADALLWLAPGQYLGLDFLGFIGLSMLVVHLFDRLPRPAASALIAVAAILAVRFVVGPALRSRLAGTPAGQVAGFLLGIDGLAGFSYPPPPWLAYPLIGSALGRFAGRRQAWIQGHPGAIAGGLTGLGLAFAAATVALAMRGWAIFRWGNMSWGFFVASLAALAFALALVVALGARPERARPLGLGGLQSYAVVPLHYLAIALLIAAIGPIGTFDVYLVALSLLVPTSFAGARLVAAVASGTRATPAIVRGLGGVVVATLVVSAVASPPAWLSVILRGAGQLALCPLLDLRRPAPSRTPVVSHPALPMPANSA